MFIFVLGDYIQHYVLVKPAIFWPNPAFPMYWPVYYFCFVPQFLVFFCIAPPLPIPSLYLTLCVSFMIPQPFPIPTLYLLLPCFIPCVHASVLEQSVPRTNLPQLTALNHDPWPPHHSTETTLRYGWSVHLCSSSILLSSCLTLLALLSF